ncbi:MAG: shikimate dehydrogenase [Pseudomonadota bacterium]
MAEQQHPSAFVIGDPIAQSKSPLIHGYWLKAQNLPGSYEAVHITPEALPEFLRQVLAAQGSETGYIGGNVTVPHKETVYRWLAQQPESARLTKMAARLKAVNTLYWLDGQLVGDNTDGYGFAANLDERATGWDSNMSQTIVVGAGGASRAVVAALDERRQETDQIHIVNRTASRAESLVADLGLSNVSIHGFGMLTDLAASATFIVNTSSLGMSNSGTNSDDGPSALEAAALALQPNAVATDIVYTPLMTPFLQAAKTTSAQTADGLGMLLHQAVPGFEAWFGVRPQVTSQVRQLVLSAMELG